MWLGKEKMEKESTMKIKGKKGINFRKGLRIIKSFKIKRMQLNIDTGDCIMNAKLFPVFAFLNYKVGGFTINFEGRNQVALHAQSRPINIIKSIFNT